MVGILGLSGKGLLSFEEFFGSSQQIPTPEPASVQREGKILFRSG